MKTQKIDETAGRIGTAMRNARCMSALAPEDMARMLRIMPDELIKYERGIAEIPFDVLERIIVMGYKMICVRSLDRKYRLRRIAFRKIKQPTVNAQ